ncbi:MAG: glutamate--tRNA ligase [Methanospirillaceae archaeon]|nr:glutamate--tRNA ligase [Methanospirillaceae archaeon]
MQDMKPILFRYALFNAVEHAGTPQAGTVLGMVMKNHPELRSMAGEMKAVLVQVIDEIKDLSPDEREDALYRVSPELFAQLHQKKEKRREHGLPDLIGADGGVVMRFAPNPSGPLHLGHARAAFLNDTYVRRYGGRYILRIEDTDPKRVDPTAYEMVQEDISWMELGIHETVYQSDRFSLYYSVGKELISRGAAYVCTCENDAFREMKMKKVACPCRMQTAEEGMAGFDQMLDGGYEEGGVTVRLKTDLCAPDPAMRDFPLFRVLTSVPHERVDAIVYPLMNLSVAVDDHLLGMTHVIRGKDHIANTGRQRFIYDYMGWDLPHYLHYGRMSIDGVVLSTSGMREGIQEGVYTGWDDVHLGTLRALARRGISPLAVRSAMVDIGIGETDISFSWENLYAKNKEVVDAGADRFFFVADPVEVTVHGAEPQVASAMRYPGDPKRGYRMIPFEGTVLLPAEEIRKRHSMVRLKDLFNVRLQYSGDTVTATYAGTDLKEARDARAPIIQWLSPGYGTLCRLLYPEGDISGVCEPVVQDLVGQMVQFERVGFARVERSDSSGLTAVYSHR